MSWETGRNGEALQAQDLLRLDTANLLSTWS